jgi:DegV family protein with EDD domain
MMAVRVVTDNVADLPADLVDRFNLTIVPLAVLFGDIAGGEKMDPDEFYSKLVESDPLPTTAAPAPADFVKCYQNIVAAGDEVVVVTLSDKLSATHAAATRAVTEAGLEDKVSVVDSAMATIAEGYIAIAAAEAAASGASRDEVVAAAESTIPRVGFLAAFDTLEYLRRGGRIGAAKALLGSVLKIHPLITLTDGIVAPYGRARSRTQAIQALLAFASGFTHIERLAIEHTACADDAADLRNMLSARYPEVVIIESRATPVIGTHTGPSLLVLSVLGDRT